MDLRAYQSLIEDFLERKISAEEFETTYLQRFKNEPAGMDPAIYDILQELFSAVDSYWAQATPEDEDPFTITEETLRKDARRSLSRLETYVASRNQT